MSAIQLLYEPVTGRAAGEDFGPTPAVRYATAIDSLNRQRLDELIETLTPAHLHAHLAAVQARLETRL